MNTITNGSIVWVKFRGYPWWPSKIESEDKLSSEFLSYKPKTHLKHIPVYVYGKEKFAWANTKYIKPFEKYKGIFITEKRTNLFNIAISKALHELYPQKYPFVKIKKENVPKIPKPNASYSTFNQSPLRYNNLNTIYINSPRNNQIQNYNSAQPYEQNTSQNIMHTPNRNNVTNLTQIQLPNQNQNGMMISTPIQNLNTNQNLSLENIQNSKQQQQQQQQQQPHTPKKICVENEIGQTISKNIITNPTLYPSTPKQVVESTRTTSHHSSPYSSTSNVNQTPKSYQKTSHEHTPKSYSSHRQDQSSSSRHHYSSPHTSSHSHSRSHHYSQSYHHSSKSSPTVASNDNTYLSPSQRHHQHQSISSPETDKVSKEKEVPLKSEEVELAERVLKIRIKLQKTLKRDLSSSVLKYINTYLDEIEKKTLSINILKYTKIGKIIKILAKRPYPFNDQYNIQQRCINLFGRWKNLLKDSTSQPNINSPSSPSIHSEGAFSHHNSHISSSSSPGSTLIPGINYSPSRNHRLPLPSSSSAPPLAQHSQPSLSEGIKPKTMEMISNYNSPTMNKSISEILSSNDKDLNNDTITPSNFYHSPSRMKNETQQQQLQSSSFKNQPLYYSTRSTSYYSPSQNTN
ncbi:hypothetical protein BCR36DRAFT_415377 [Piromyces finnis]|uniref:PWWP domain-containing protein n=1 Tax=Piromyces finnis TaxID=1754191 RepID=A0A1Y1V0H9_9FUNG|nr:hypothetical protein BCR36DRAFT_415377 [Piromyces finnis]|eukprot:ORX43779.1 hypothetical protein BCR36DRAFT_415377 [Piromyces finnis]